MYRARVRLNLTVPASGGRGTGGGSAGERGVPMELWQMDVAAGFVLADGTRGR